MSRDCTRCGGFGEYMQITPNAMSAYVSCPDCDGYGILPSEDKGQSRRTALVKVAIFAIGLAGGIVSTAIALSHLPGVCR